jgi:hypothetical protein
MPDAYNGHDSTSQKAAGALLTRHEAAQFVNNELGRPMSFSTLTKLCALGEGPPVASQWGRRPLYDKPGLREWAETRGRSPRNSAAPSPSAAAASAQPAAAPTVTTPLDVEASASRKSGRLGKVATGAGAR